jgi:hypothetical protein
VDGVGDPLEEPHRHVDGPGRHLLEDVLSDSLDGSGDDRAHGVVATDDAGDGLDPSQARSMTGTGTASHGRLTWWFTVGGCASRARRTPGTEHVAGAEEPEGAGEADRPPVAVDQQPAHADGDGERTDVERGLDDAQDHEPASAR